jgi:hypothetical protein
METETAVEIVEAPGNGHKWRAISFRVSEEDYRRIESAAFSIGETPNGWSRKVTLAECDSRVGMTPGEWESYKQIIIVRHMLGHWLKANQSPEEFTKLKNEIDTRQEKIAELVLAKSRGRQE